MPADVQISESFLVYPNANHAELPVYDARDNKVLFIDMEPQPAVHSVRLDGSDHQSFALKEAEFCTGIFLTEREGEVLGW
jgi:sugar lactone lactonase YvrE